ncbi:MAG: MFS transporter [Pseudomonadota bacterium]|jgi:Arabinose efflux permease|nr:MAG: MFS transporter [Pseudomonadota bacterium]
MERSLAASETSQVTARGVVPLVILAALIMFVDGADMAAMPLAVPYIVREWGISPAEFGIALSAMPLGFGVGGLLIGPLGDHYGRRPVIIGTVLLVALTTIATAFSREQWHFFLLRFLGGIGLGGCLTNLNALVAEIVPKTIRARLLTLIACGIPIGGAAAGMVAPPAVAVGGWQGVFILLGGGILLFTLALLLWLPSPPPTGDSADADRAGQAEKKAVPLATLLQPLKGDFRLMSFVFIGLYSMNMLSIFMLQSWLPTILSQTGFEPDQASRLTALMQGGGLVGGLVISYFVDRGKTVLTLSVAYLMVVALLNGFGLLDPTVIGWGALILLIGGGIMGAHLAIMALGTFFYPRHMLASALGLAVAAARAGAVAGPLLGQLLVQHEAGAHGFFLSLLGPIAFCLFCVSLIPRVDRRRAKLGL